MPGPEGAPRADIIALLAEGHSDRYIARTLNAATKRIRKIRADLQLPRARRKATITADQKWATFTRPTEGGHLAWTGHHRAGQTPMFMLHGHNYSARRIAFRIAHGREPQGRVRAGCGWPPCVAPDHVEDAAMRAQYAAIFGGAA